MTGSTSCRSEQEKIAAEPGGGSNVCGPNSGKRTAPPRYAPLDLCRIIVGPGNRISWDDAKTMIKHGDVKYVAQSHSLEVVIYLANDESYYTTEPEIDAVIRWVREVGKQDWIGVMTE